MYIQSLNIMLHLYLTGRVLKLCCVPELEANILNNPHKYLLTAAAFLHSSKAYTDYLMIRAILSSLHQCTSEHCNNSQSGGSVWMTSVYAADQPDHGRHHRQPWTVRPSPHYGQWSAGPVLCAVWCRWCQCHLLGVVGLPLQPATVQHLAVFNLFLTVVGKLLVSTAA